jgi:hypothetical protein
MTDPHDHAINVVTKLRLTTGYFCAAEMLRRGTVHP